MKFATEFGFFLHIPHFRHSALLPEGHRDKPHKGLLSIVQLLGHHLRREQNKKFHDSQEHTFLSLAILHQPNIISSSHPNKVVHAIQAEILLGMYFYHTSRPSTAKYHLNAALAMALAAGAHKICNYDTTLFQYPAGKDLEEERHRIMEGEKINGFWVALSLNVCLVVALHSPIDEVLLLQTQVSNLSIDTPWPMDIQSYATSIVKPAQNNRSTMDLFFNHYPSGALAGMGKLDALAMYIQSSMLLGRAYIVRESISSARANRNLETLSVQV
ncbi:hypothetical protein F5051DRAFT_499939, partial [Lentinula edodes]